MARPASRGDGAAQNKGQSPTVPATSGLASTQSTIHAHYNDVSEQCNQAESASANGVAHVAYVDQALYAFSTEMPSFLPPISAEFAPLAPPAQELGDGPREMVHLPRLLANSASAPEVLEAAVETGKLLIRGLAGYLAPQASAIPEASRFLTSLKTLEAESTPPRTVVGVVGNTGAGKSSVINAVLDEDELLPTNCLRACTASPTEISYNHSDDPEALYLAEVEFITGEDWTSELRYLHAELLDGNGDVSRECTNPDSDAGMAYAKVKAVYPQKTKEALASGNPRDFADEPAVKNVLGTKRQLQARSALDLCRGLQQYVDSKEKQTVFTSRSSPMEFWPLVKVVRIYTKAAALSTGAVIVDLPGVQDANPARAAVATSYMKACSSLWIVAPITRAVDDKTAKTLLGDSFKRQLKYDGTISAVTFICSKTDDILVKEAVRNLSMENMISTPGSYADGLGSKEEEDQLMILLDQQRARKDEYAEYLDQCDATIDTWEDLQQRSRSGMTVYDPLGPITERKRKYQPEGSMRNQASPHEPDDCAYAYASYADDGWGAYGGFSPHETPVPLTEDVITRNLQSLKARRRDFRDVYRQMESRMNTTWAVIVHARSKRECHLAQVKAACIKGRNEYSRKAIKADFVMGIKELDQENTADEDFDPDEDSRDYDKVGQDLSVFCVSSRAFQNLRGKLGQGDFDGQGYATAEDTEIPQLQEHARKLTEDGRIKTCQRFLNKLVQLLNSMNFWAFDNGSTQTLSEGGKEQEINHFIRLIDMLQKKGFHVAIRESLASMKQAMRACIINDFGPAIKAAINSAIGTCEGWGALTSQGGLCWSTYKATVRRNGAYSGSGGARDFNAELFEPIAKLLATGWERAFQRRFPAILAEFARACQGHLEIFLQGVRQRPTEGSAGGPQPLLLISQIGTHKHTLNELPDRIMKIVTELQREASRRAVPVIRAAMIEIYEECLAEKGPGSFARMKAAMLRHVEANRANMFHNAVGTIMQSFEALCDVVKKEEDATTRAVTESVCREYKTELIDAGAKRQRGVSQREQELKACVRDCLRGADDAFIKLLPEGYGSASGEGLVGPAQGSVAELPRNGFAGTQQPYWNNAEAEVLHGDDGEHGIVKTSSPLASIARSAQEFLERG